MCGLFLMVKFSCLFTAVAVLACLRSLIDQSQRAQDVTYFIKNNIILLICSIFLCLVRCENQAVRERNRCYGIERIESCTYLYGK